MAQAENMAAKEAFQQETDGRWILLTESATPEFNLQINFTRQTPSMKES